MDEKFYYTVERLMEDLKKMPADLPILISGPDGGYDNFYYPEVVSLKHEPDSFEDEGEFQPAETGEPEAFKAVVLIRADRED